MNISRMLVEHARAVSHDALPEEARDRARYFLLDHLGVALRAVEAASSRVLHNFARKRAPKEGPCTIVGSDMRTDAPHAALVNGGVSHATEMDDVTTRSSLHPGVSVMPTALAVAEMRRSGPKEVIAAIVAGYETANRIGNALNPTSHYERGFHPTGTCGAFAAAIVASKLLGLSVEATANAMGIAGSQAAGSMQYLDNGAWTKRFHPGWAAHSGVMAACLAQEGYTGPEDILGGKTGFLRGHSDDCAPECVVERLGEYWEICETAIKPYACCRYNHAAIDAAISVCRAHDIQPEEVERVEVRVPETSVMVVIEPCGVKTNPQNIVDAQFSLQYAVAVAILRRAAGLDEYADDFLRARAYSSLIGKIECRGDAEMEKEFPDKWQARVRIETARGAFKAHQDHPKGDARNPLTWEELIERFRVMTAPVLEREAGELLIERVRNLESLDDVSGVMELVAGAEGVAA